MNNAESIAKVTGSVGATTVYDRRDAGGNLVIEKVEMWDRETDTRFETIPLGSSVYYLPPWYSLPIPTLGVLTAIQYEGGKVTYTIDFGSRFGTPGSGYNPSYVTKA